MKTRSSRRISALIAVLAVAFGVQGSALADRGSDLRAELERIQKEINNTKAQLQGNRAQQNNLVTELGRIDREMSVLIIEVKRLSDELEATIAERTRTEQQLAALKVELQNTLKELEQAKELLVRQKKILAGRVRNIYMKGDVAYLSVLLNSSSFGDFLSRSAFLTFIAEQDARLVSKIQETKTTIERKEAQQRRERASIEEKQASLVQQEKRIAGLKSVQEGKLAALQAEKADRQAVVQKLQQDETSLAALQDEEAAASEWVASQINKWNAKVAEEARARAAEEEAKRRAAAAAAAAASPQPAPAPATGQEPAPAPSYSEPAPAPAPPAPVYEWVWPVGTMADITSPFGWRIHPVYGTWRLHTGVDIAAYSGTPIKAGHSGVVSFTGWAGAYGLYTVIENGDGVSTAYAHQSYIAVSVGDYVRAGQTIGYVGSTGASTGPHLHYEIYVDGVPNNPLDWY